MQRDKKILPKQIICLLYIYITPFINPLQYSQLTNSSKYIKQYNPTHTCAFPTLFPFCTAATHFTVHLCLSGVGRSCMCKSSVSNVQGWPWSPARPCGHCGHSAQPAGCGVSVHLHPCLMQLQTHRTEGFIALARVLSFDNVCVTLLTLRRIIYW